jgi:hypothetical protein
MKTQFLRQHHPRHDETKKPHHREEVADRGPSDQPSLSRKPNPMKGSGKSKHVSPEAEIWSDPRKRYAWHVLPPVKGKFDSTHWWVGKSTPEPHAALYELARRHPEVYLALLRRDSDRVAEYKEEYDRLNQSKVPLEAMVLLMGMVNAFADSGGYSKAVAFLVLFGLKSWPKLSETEQDQWKFSAGFIKGVDCRPEGERCYSLQETLVRAAQLSPLVKALGALAGPQQGMAREALGPRGPRPKNHEMKLSTGAAITGDMESFIAQEAIRAYRSGHILIASSPDLGYDEAERLLVKTFRNSQQLLSGPAQKKRARFEDWLPLIAGVEPSDPAVAVRSAAFNHYRRAIDGLQFPSAPRETTA